MSDGFRNDVNESSESRKNLIFWITYGVLLLASVAAFVLSGSKLTGWIALAVIFIVLFFLKDLFLDFGKLKTGIAWFIVVLILALTYGTAVKGIFTANKGTKSQARVEGNDGRAPNVDLGTYVGKAEAVSQTHSKIPAFDITLKQITVGTKNFGKPIDGTWLINTFPDNNLNESKYIIEQYTIKAKKLFDLKNISFNITYQGVTSGNGQVSPGGITPAGIKRFGFYQRGTTLPIKAGETKDVKIFTKLTNQVLAADKIFIQVMEPNGTVGNQQNKGQFEITAYVK